MHVEYRRLGTKLNPVSNSSSHHSDATGHESHDLSYGFGKGLSLADAYFHTRCMVRVIHVNDVSSGFAK